MSAKKIFGKFLFCLAYDVFTHPWVYTPFAFQIIDLLDKNGHVDKDAVMRTELPKSYLCQMSSMQASLILKGLKGWKQQAEASGEIAQAYTQALQSKQESVVVPDLPSASYQTYLQFPVWVKDSNVLFKKHLRKRKVDINIDFFRDVSSLECFAEYQQDCPNTQRLLKHLALLPTYPRQDQAYTQRVAKGLDEF